MRALRLGTRAAGEEAGRARWRRQDAGRFLPRPRSPVGCVRRVRARRHRSRGGRCRCLSAGVAIGAFGAGSGPASSHLPPSGARPARSPSIFSPKVMQCWGTSARTLRKIAALYLKKVTDLARGGGRTLGLTCPFDKLCLSADLFDGFWPLAAAAAIEVNGINMERGQFSRGNWWSLEMDTEEQVRHRGNLARIEAVILEWPAPLHTPHTPYKIFSPRSMIFINVYLEEFTFMNSKITRSFFGGQVCFLG